MLHCAVALGARGEPADVSDCPRRENSRTLRIACALGIGHCGAWWLYQIGSLELALGIGIVLPIAYCYWALLTTTEALCEREMDTLINCY